MSEQLSSFLGAELGKLVSDGELLMASCTGGYTDYSFTIFPFAKAYEGFLKKLFFQMGAITKNQFLSDHWRVGKALNPELEKEISHDESVYDRIALSCGSNDPHDSNGEGNQIADKSWKAWTNGRNRIFHYFPEQYKPITLPEARSIVSQIMEAMELGVATCKTKLAN